MKAGKDKQLDYLLINLVEQPQRPNREEAEQYRDKNAVRRDPWTILGTDEYHRYGPGVCLYFTLLKYLSLLFLILTVVALPSLLINVKGGGLDLYGGSLGRSLMQFSLANQPSLAFEKDELTLQEQQSKIATIKRNEIILIINDILISLTILCFMIFWRLKSQELITQMVKKQALPSYHTILIDLPQTDITQENIKTHFQKFGDVRQVSFVYEYGTFLLEVKEFLTIIEQYSQETDKDKKDKIYDQISDNYNKIKNLYQSSVNNNVTIHQHPFTPKIAFISFEDPQLAHRVVAAYRYKVSGVEFKINDQLLPLRSCNVEPLSIIWQNFHLPSCSQIKRSWLFGLLVACILLVTLFGIFLMSLHTWQKQTDYSSEFENVTFETALASTDSKVINSFCSSLNYKTFQLRYYQLCETYFTNFEHHWVFVLTVSGVIVGINLFLIKIVFALAELRRFRTLPEKKRFLTLSIFLTYFFSSSVLAILIRGQLLVGEKSLSLVALAKFLFPSVPSVEVYSEATRKWYLYIGKLLTVNYLLTLNICPWLYVAQEWILSKFRSIWCRMAKTQRQAKERLIDSQFYWQFYYAVQLNAIYFGLIFSMAMPLFYPLTLISIFSLFITSKVIFHRFTKQPQVYDHKMNSFISTAITIALLLHQFSSCYFLSVEDIFPIKDELMVSTSTKKIVYYILAAIVFLVAIFPKKVASLVRRKASNKDELMMTQEINSSFGARSQQMRQVQPKKKHKVPLVRQLRKDSYLNSYKMQDNPYYNNISYTLLILYQTIIENKDPDIQKSIFQLRSEEGSQDNQKIHQSLNQEKTSRIMQVEVQDTQRVLNQSA